MLNMNENIKVLVRVRPQPQNKNSIFHIQGSQLTLRKKKNINTNSNKSQTFTFDYVYGMDTTQQQIFEIVGKRLADKCLHGYNGTIFAYGQTGSGKTYTIEGSNNDLGLLPRIVHSLFESTKIRATHSQSVEYSIKCQCFEIYKNSITDLLSTNNNNLQIRGDGKGTEFYVQNLTAIQCKTYNQWLKQVQIAQSRRKKAETHMNKRSSRSHLLIVIIINELSVNNSNTSVIARASKLTLVDLAGSEKNANGDRLTESKFINKSLTTLGIVIRKIVKGNGHIPFRDSKLTQLLKNSLGGNSLTYMIANVSGSESNAAESLSTLQFANHAKEIKNIAKLNKSATVDTLKKENSKFVGLIHELTQNNKCLQAELKEKDAEIEQWKLKEHHWKMNASDNMSLQCISENSEQSNDCTYTPVKKASKKKKGIETPCTKAGMTNLTIKQLQRKLKSKGIPYKEALVDLLMNGKQNESMQIDNEDCKMNSEK